MRFAQSLLPGRLISRYKRFLADIRLASGEIITAHCPNSGSMLGCAQPGFSVMVSVSTNPARRYKHTWELVDPGTAWVGINTMRTNAIVAEALRAGKVAALQGFSGLQAEVPYGENSRIDFVLTSADQKVFVEVKNVTLAEHGCAYFPDAITQRGRKHLHELMQVVAAGERGVMFFLVQRPDTHFFRPARRIDIAYSKTLAEAATKGVEILVYDCSVNEHEVVLRNPVPWEI